MPKMLSAQGQAMIPWNASCQAGLVPQPCTGVQHRGSWALGSAHPLWGNSSTTQRSNCKVEAENYRTVRKISQKISLEQVRKDDKFQLSEKLTWESEHCFTCRIDLSIQRASQSPNKTNPHLLCLDAQTGHYMIAAEYSRSQVWKPIPTGRQT